MPPPSHDYVEPQGKRLLHPLHYQRQFEAVIGFDVKREPRALNLKPAHLETVTLFRLAENAAEERFGPRKLEERLADIKNLSGDKKQPKKEYETGQRDRVRSWELSDERWGAVKAFESEHRRDENRDYRRKPGGGKKPIEPRRVLKGIFYVLRTGIQRKALPKGYGAAGSIREYSSEWAEAGFFRRMWKEGLTV